MKKHTISVFDPKKPPARETELAWLIAASALDAGAVEEDIAELVVNRLIDSVGVAIAAFDGAPIAHAYGQALAHPRAGGATLIGIDDRVTVDAEWAAYANATAMRQLDWSDTFGAADYSHPSDNTAAMIAVAQQCGLSGADIIRGIALGYQTEISLVDTIDLHDHGIDQFANLGPAIAAGLSAMLKLPVEQAYSAVGLSAYLSTTTFQVRSGKISGWKGAGTGWTNHAAICAVDRAMRGEDSPSPVYEGQYGTIATLLGGTDVKLTVNLLDKGEAPRAMALSFPKRWAAEYMAQPFIDLAFRMRATIPDLDAIKDIMITGSKDMVSVIGGGDPEKYSPDAPRGTLDHSLMYIVAVALEDGTWDKDASYSPERAHRPDTVALWRNIHTEEGKAWTDAFNQTDPAKRKFGGQMVVTMNDGSVIRDQIDNADSYNYPTPWGRADYAEKFRAVTKGLVEPNEQDRFLDLVKDLPTLTAPQLARIFPVTMRAAIGDGGKGIF